MKALCAQLVDVFLLTMQDQNNQWYPQLLITDSFHNVDHVLTIPAKYTQRAKLYPVPGSQMYDGEEKEK